MKLKVKFLSKEAKLPSKTYPTDAGYDLSATTKTFDDKGNIVYGTGIAVFIPDGFVGLLFPRSSISNRTLALANSVGVVDSHYTGEVKLKFKPTAYYQERSTEDFEYEIGDRIGQLVILEIPTVELQTVEELPEIGRAVNGFGSTGY